ncbi:unnamed protein product [Rotaria sp. Silwood1]|nr:unnamed protein product [Rotaria sp. Silwood1]CAF3911733.1 unnamed protein product [Rotaria sp. Silwood1]CAF4905505.1 unnamed protein product [Rotaria sp. Silwood1]CAF4975708.1 unnamed protein product [Rotaria sp. Silwood1]CAF4980715.1 unnamed protein product [Rotaria sp. Silwood1]
MEYQNLNSPSGSDQGGKRGRTPSDDDNERHVTRKGTPKRSRSVQRNTRTFINSSRSATTTVNNDADSNSRMDDANCQSNNNNGKKINNDNDSSIFNFSRSVIDYAINLHLPPIKIICEPKIGFKGVNPRHNDVIGFDSWYIDVKGDICCITNDIELFVYLCDDNHVSRTNNGRTRFIRIDLLNYLEYKQILNAGVICIDGQCLQVHEYLAAPRVIFCSMCNLPGHTKRNCKFSYERCKRCGGNRKAGDHKECKIICHNCKGDHVATDFRCPLVHSYRKELIHYLRQHPEAFPNDTQIFIPSNLRQEGGKVLGKRMVDKNQSFYYYKSSKIDPDPLWPSLSPKSTVYEPNVKLSYQNLNLKEQLNLKDFLARIEKDCNEAKQEYDKKFNDTTTKINMCLNQIQSLMNCFSSTIQRQNEMIYVLKTSLNECLEITKITNQALCLLLDQTGEQQYKDIIKQISAIPLEERQTSINKFFSAYSPLIDEITMKIMDATEKLHIHNG